MKNTNIQKYSHVMIGFNGKHSNAIQNRKSTLLFLLMCLLYFLAINAPSFSHRITRSVIVDNPASLRTFVTTDPPIGRTSTVLLGIFSMTSEKAAIRRDLIRDTYLQDGTGKVCPLELFKEQSKRPGHARQCQVAYTFIIGAGGDSRPTDHDDLEPLTLKTDANGEYESDCTYLNIKENMEYGKSPTYMKFAASIAAEYGLHYVAKIDDDSLLGIDAFMSFVNDNLPPAPFNKRIYGGRMVMTTLYPFSGLYPMGQFYFVSSDLAEYVGVELSGSIRRELSYKIEDLDMAVYISSNPYPIKYVDPSNVMFWIHPLKEEVAFMNEFEKVSHTLPKWKPDMTKFGMYCKKWLWHVENRGFK